MATRGVKITGLNTLPNVVANTTLAVVDLTLDETLRTSVQAVGNFILAQAGNIFPAANVANTVRNNAQPNITSVGTLVNLTVSGVSTLGPVGNVRITGGNSGQLLATYGNGTLYWSNDITPGGPDTSVQFNNNGQLGGSNSFTYTSSNNTVYIQNLDATNIDVDTITIGNFHIQGLGNGTSQQVLGIVDQSTQQLGWKTVPVYYITVDMRDGSNYLSSPDPVLRVYPVGQRDGSYLDLNVSQI